MLAEGKSKIQGISIMKFKTYFSIVIPAYNEEARIEGTLRKWIDFLDRFCPGEYEILVIMDGCTDNTVNIVSKFANECVVPLVYSKRLGKGGALIEAFKYSRGNVVFFTDADGSLSVDNFVSFANAIESGDLVIGCRYFKGSGYIANLPLRRFVLSRIFNGLVRILFPELRRLHDTQCGAKAVRRDTLYKVMSYLFITDFTFDINLIYSFLRHGFVIKEIAVDYDYVENESKVSHRLFKVCFRMFLSLVRLRLYYSKFRKLLFNDGVWRRFVDFMLKVVS